MEEYDRREFLSLSLPGFLGVFTPPYDKARIEKSRWFEIPPDPLLNHHGIFEAKVS